MSLASCRHERINTRKTLIIESCPDDDLVNLEFLDQVRFNVFISSSIDRAKVQSCWFRVCVFFFVSAGDNNQPSPEEIWWAAGLHVCWWHPHRSQSFSESQHLLSPGWLQTGHTDVPSSCPVRIWLLTSHATGSASVNIHISYCIYV